MASAIRERETAREPIRAVCASCGDGVLLAIVPPLPRDGRPALLVTVEPWEWEPRAACQSCAWTRARMGKLADCPRCDGTGYVGEERPDEPLLAIDCAWSDEGHVRLLEPSTSRKKGEALYRLHDCDQAAIVPLTPELERQAV